MNRDNLHVWTYKDSHRYYWKIEAWKSDEIVAHWDPDVIDWEWAYEIYREDSSNSIYHSSINGQYDIVPDPEEFFQDFLNYLIDVAIGVGKHAVQATIHGDNNGTISS